MHGAFKGTGKHLLECFFAEKRRPVAEDLSNIITDELLQRMREVLASLPKARFVKRSPFGTALHKWFGKYSKISS